VKKRQFLWKFVVVSVSTKGFSFSLCIYGAGVKQIDKTHKERVLEFILLQIYIFGGQENATKDSARVVCRRCQAINMDLLIIYIFPYFFLSSHKPGF